MRLSVDHQVQGFNKDIESVTDMKAAVVSLIDENVEKVVIKKRAVKDNHHCVGGSIQNSICKPQKMRVTMEANVMIVDDSVSFYPGGQKILKVELIHSN